jgi:hypothetical protein
LIKLILFRILTAKEDKRFKFKLKTVKKNPKVTLNSTIIFVTFVVIKKKNAPKPGAFLYFKRYN